MANPKSRFFKAFKKHFFLRFHMSLILVATGLSGLLGTKLLMWSGVESILIRYPLNVVFAYLCFFLFVKTWLWYISPNRESIDAIDGLDLVNPWDSSTGYSSPQAPLGDGGTFGGAGASGDFAGASLVADDGSGEGLLGRVAGNLDIDLDGDAFFPLVLLGVILLAVFGSGLYLLYEAPVILTEARLFSPKRPLSFCWPRG